MSVPIVAQRKRWTKKAQRELPGHKLCWMYGQLRDLGSGGRNYLPRDVPGIPVIMSDGGRTRSASELFPQPSSPGSCRNRRPEVSATRTLSRSMDESSVGQNEGTFIPIDRVEELSSADLSFLRQCNITHGYFDHAKDEFVVKRGMTQFRGRGSRAQGWR